MLGDFLDAIGEENKAKVSPVLYLAAVGAEDVKKEGLNLLDREKCEWLVKPVSIEVLKQSITGLLS